MKNVKFNDWPECDRVAFCAKLQPGSILDAGSGSLSHLRAPSIKQLKYGYGCWLGYLLSQNIFDLNRSGIEFLSPELFREYVTLLRSTLASKTVVGYIDQFGRLARLLHPQSDWRLVQTTARQLQRNIRPIRDIRTRCRPSIELYHLGNKLIEKSEGRPNPMSSARQFRNGLMIAFLAARPLRIRNLSMIAVNRHLQLRALVATYTDHAISGSIRMRPGYQKLLEDARSGEFDVVVSEALDRLSRDQEDVAALHKHLLFSDVKLITISEGEISELHVGLKGTMNALLLKDLAQKTRRGLEGRVREGKSAGGLCFGYDVVRAHDPRGEPIYGGRKVNDAEASVVRRIFSSFAAGNSPRPIAIELNREHIPGPRGGYWDASTINGNAARGTGILNNELYIGRLIWNRLRYIKDPTTGKRVSRLNGPDRWIVKDVPLLVSAR